MEPTIITAINELLPTKATLEKFLQSKLEEHYYSPDDNEKRAFGLWIKQSLDAIKNGKPVMNKAPSIPAGFEAAIMPVKYGRPKYALDDEGRLIGLNLGGLGLDDTQWETISNVLEREGVRLQALNLRENRLKRLESLPSALDLKYLDIGGNELEEPPPEVVSKGTDAILRHFVRLQSTSEKTRFYEAKVLLVGKSGAGKTSLRYKLRHPDTPMPKEDESTKGIDVEPIKFILKNGKEFRMNVWDFEGQQISHQTHQFFLTKRSFYVFVADQRTEKPDFDYWLQVVELLSASSPMLMFNNEKKGSISNLNLDGIRKPFGHFLLNEVYRSDLDKVGKGKNFDEGQREKFIEFRKALEKHLQSLPIVDFKIEKSWVDVRKAIESLAKLKPHISANELWVICEEKGIKKDQDKRDLSQLFHDLGIFLHYQDDNKPSLLNRMVILQNEWATKAVYMALKSEWLEKEKHGQFTLADLRRVWQKTNYLNHCEELLELMMRFELCYLIEKSNVLIAPQLLPSSPEKDYVFPESEVMLLRFGYDFMPKGIITRLTVRMHPMIARGQTLAWKDGFVLENHGATAEIVETYGMREIHIRATGDNRRKLLNEIAYEIHRLNSEYNFSERIQSYMLLPCCCADCKESAEPHFHKYAAVQTSKEKGWNQIPCGRTGNPANVADLLANILEGREKEIFDAQHAEAELAAIRMNQKSHEYLLKELLDYAKAYRDYLVPINVQAEKGLLNEMALQRIMDVIKVSMEEMTKKLPSTDELILKWQQVSKKLPHEVDSKLKFKLALPLLPFIVEKEVAFDAKASANLIWDNLKALAKGNISVKELIILPGEEKK